jgi:hypothetical protein
MRNKAVTARETTMIAFHRSPVRPFNRNCPEEYPIMAKARVGG